MKTIPELLSLYESFFKGLSKKIDKDSDDPAIRSEEFEAPTDKQIKELEEKLEIKVPEEIKVFWKNIKHVYEASGYDEENWVVGRDFMPLANIIRGALQQRDMAKKMEDGFVSKKLHETGIPLTYEEPILLFDSNTGNIHQLLWDGEPVVDAIAPNLATFLEHWLAVGCFYQGDFDTYYNHVKDIVPVKIPLKDNLWMKYRAKYDAPKQVSDPEAMAHLENLEKAYDEGNAAIRVWRAGKEKEAAETFTKVISTAQKLGDYRLANATVCNYAGLCSEAGRPEESIKILQNYIQDNPESANKDSKVFRRLGQFMYESGKLKEGFEVCNKAINMEPENAMGYYTRACAHVRLKNLKEAITDVATAIKLDPGLREDILNDSDFVPLKDMTEFKKAISKN